MEQLEEKKLYGEGILEIIENALHISETAQKIDQNVVSVAKQVLGKMKFNKEYKTIKIKLPRGTGKSWAIREFCKKNKNVVLSSPSLRITKLLIQDKKITYISSLRDIEYHSDVDYFIIDEASQMSYEFIDKLYRSFDGKFIVLVG